MTDQEKAREELKRVIHTALYASEDFEEVDMITDAVLSADPRVIAEAMGGTVRLITGAAARVEIVLPPRKVETDA